MSTEPYEAPSVSARTENCSTVLPRSVCLKGIASASGVAASPAESRRIYALDTLRGAAALVVVIWHYQWFFASEPFATFFFPFYQNGQIAVDIFFVISGFILTHVYDGRVNDIKALAIFIMKRIARLYPLHLLTLTVTALLFFFFYKKTGNYGWIYLNNNFYHFMLNLLMIQYVGFQAGWSFNAPSWTISAEFWVNILFAFTLLAKRRVALAVVAVSSSAALLIFVMQAWHGTAKVGGWLDIIIVRTVAGFFAGVLTYQLRRTAPRLALVGMAAGIVLTLAVMAHPRTDPNVIYFEAAESLIVAPMTVWAVSHSPLAERVANTLPGRWLGDISFSVYLWHFPVAGLFVLIGADSLPSTVLFIVYLVSVLFVATLSFKFFEWPARNYILKWNAGSLTTNARYPNGS